MISFFAKGFILLIFRDLEEELTVVGKNLQQLEVGEEQTRVREEKLQIQILELRWGGLRDWVKINRLFKKNK